MVRNDEQPAGLWMELSAGTWNDSCPLHTCICNFTACYASIQNCPQQRKQFHTADRRQHIFPTVEYANGTAINGHASIVAYSGATYNNSGTTFINGMTTKLVALSGGGFSYTPTYTPNAFNAPEYGYFIVNDTTFIMYEVSPPTPTSGTLQVGIDTPYGLVTSGSAQVPMFTMV